MKEAATLVVKTYLKSLPFSNILKFDFEYRKVDGITSIVIFPKIKDAKSMGLDKSDLDALTFSAMYSEHGVFIVNKLGHDLLNVS